MTDKLIPLQNSFDYKVQNWLNSKRYNGNKYHLDVIEPKNNVHHILDYYNYYYDDDQDVKANDDYYINLLQELRENDPDEIDDDDSLYNASIVEERYINPSRIIKEKTENTWETAGKANKEIYYLKELPVRTSVLIPPNTNRYRVNDLFKKIIDYCYDKDLVYGNFNSSKTVAEHEDPNGDTVDLTELIFNRDMKDSFYELCYLNKK